jgi:hypothetical protein
MDVEIAEKTIVSQTPLLDDEFDEFFDADIIGSDIAYPCTDSEEPEET